MLVKRMVLYDVPPGAVVRYRGEWGVVCGSYRSRWRIIDFWWGGRRHVPDVAEVEVQT